MSGRKYSNLKIGSRVQYSILINNLKKRVYGTLAYGPGPFHVKPNENDWCGVVLDEPLGKNNGSIQGKQYFDCADNHGVMVRASTLVLKSDGSRIPAPGQSSSRSTTPCNVNKYKNIFVMYLFLNLFSIYTIHDTIIIYCILYRNV